MYPESLEVAAVQYWTEISNYHAGIYSWTALHEEVPKGLRRVDIKFYSAAV